MHKPAVTILGAQNQSNIHKTAVKNYGYVEENKQKTASSKSRFMSGLKNTVVTIGLSFGIATSGVQEAQAHHVANQMLMLQPSEAKVMVDMICGEP